MKKTVEETCRWKSSGGRRSEGGHGFSSLEVSTYAAKLKFLSIYQTITEVLLKELEGCSQSILWKFIFICLRWHP
jgi:hypothetical protein